MERVPGSESASTGGDQVAQVKEQAKQQTQQVAQQVRQQAGSLADRGTEQVKSQLANQKHEAAQRMTPVQTALREAAQQLRKQGQGPVAEYTDKASDQVERFAGYLRETDVDEILDEARSFARRRPGLFLGGAVALGFLATRFLKSSSEEGASADYGYRATPTATSSATVTYGTEEPTTALPPSDVEVEPPTAGAPLSDRERTEPPRDLRGQ